jgi:ribonuclease HI
VDKCIPWGHFDGVFQGQNMAIGLGISFFLSDSHYFHFKANMGSATNNIGELMDLFYMLKFSLGMGMRSFQVFDDSLMVIN